MSILIVDNGTRYLEKVKGLLAGYTFVVQSADQADPGSLDQYFGIILTGGHAFPVIGNEDKFSNEITIIRAARQPVLGICFGFEIIAQAFGATLEKMVAQEHGILEMKVAHNDQLFTGITNFKVYENHRWVVTKLPPDLIELAQSRDGVEALKHQSRPLYGLQFHPEMFVDQTCGQTIFRNWLRLTERSVDSVSE